MRTEYEREARLETAQTEQTLNQPLQQWQQARPLAQHAVQTDTDFRFLDPIILEQFNGLTFTLK